MGLASRIQRITAISPNAHHELICDRTTIKYGDSISANECERLHGDIVEHMKTTQYTDRFAPSHSKVRKVSSALPCEHQVQDMVMPLRYSAAIFDQKKMGAGHVWTFDAPGLHERKVFIMATSHRKAIFAALGLLTLSPACGMYSVKLFWPAVVQKLSEFLRESVPIAPVERGHTVCSLRPQLIDHC